MLFYQRSVFIRYLSMQSTRRGLSVKHTDELCKKTAELIVRPFGRRQTRVCPRNDILDESPNLPMGRGTFERGHLLAS